jgi:lipopolysaccharide export system protein LptA
MIHIKYILIYILISFSATAFVPGQPSLAGNKSQSPVNIKSDEAEWDNKKNLFIARGHAKLTQEDKILNCDEIHAFFEKDDKGQNQLVKAIAKKNVVMTSDSGCVRGDEGTYYADRQYLHMTGKKLSLVTPKNDRLFADKTLEYWMDEQRAKAVGNVRLYSDDKQINADSVIAFFAKPEGSEKLELIRASAEGNLHISSSTQIAEAVKGNYDAVEGVAILEDDVIITQGDNIIKGDWAKSSFKTGVSTLKANKDAPNNRRVVGYLVSSGKAGGELGFFNGVKQQ